MKKLILLFILFSTTQAQANWATGNNSLVLFHTMVSGMLQNSQAAQITTERSFKTRTAADVLVFKSRLVQGFDETGLYEYYQQFICRQASKETLNKRTKAALCSQANYAFEYHKASGRYKVRHSPNQDYQPLLASEQSRS